MAKSKSKAIQAPMTRNTDITPTPHGRPRHIAEVLDGYVADLASRRRPGETIPQRDALTLLLAPLSPATSRRHRLSRSAQGGRLAGWIRTGSRCASVTAPPRSSLSSGRSPTSTLEPPHVCVRAVAPMPSSGSAAAGRLLFAGVGRTGAQVPPVAVDRHSLRIRWRPLLVAACGADPAGVGSRRKPTPSVQARR